MKVLVLPMSLNIGGSELNAIELSRRVSESGHDVALFAPTGPLAEIAESGGLRVITASERSGLRPSVRVSLELRDLIRREKPDIVHAYEADSSTEAFFAAAAQPTGIVSTIYGMGVDAYLPRGLPTIAGTCEIAAALRETRPNDSVYVVEPPVDVVENSPDEEDGATFRRQHDVGSHEQLIVMVSRLDVWMKFDGMMDAIDAADDLARSRPVRLLVVGGGPARPALQERARRVNERHGHDVVAMTGPMTDPRPAYRAADVVVGMGTSALRGMAIAKPTVVVGEMGYVLPIMPDVMAPLLQQGFWGVGAGRRAHGELASTVAAILDLSQEQRLVLGQFGRALVVERFSLEATTEKLLRVYADVAANSATVSFSWTECVRVPYQIALRKVSDLRPSRRLAERRLLGTDRLASVYEPLLATPKARLDRYWSSPH